MIGWGYPKRGPNQQTQLEIVTMTLYTIRELES